MKRIRHSSSGKILSRLGHCCSADAHIVLFLVEGRLVLLPSDERDLLLLDVVHKLRVQLLRAYDVLFDVGAFLVALLPVDWRFDVDFRLLEVLLVEFLERNRADRCIGVLLLKCSVRNKR